MILLASAMLSWGQHRIQVVIDNDFAGDPDGLFALAQLMRTPSVDVKAIIGSHLHVDENWVEKGQSSAKIAGNEVRKLEEVMNGKWTAPIICGSESALADTLHPLVSEASRCLVDLAMRQPADHPLYVLCGGGLTEIASAWLQQSEIAKHIILIWIGGAEYPEFHPAPGNKTEYNTTIDRMATQVIFNRSDIPIWQVPRNAYRQCLTTYSILKNRLGKSTTGNYLLSKLDRFIGPGQNSDAYVLGDSPLVLLSALQCNWERDAASSDYQLESCPTVNKDGRFSFTSERRSIRVYSRIDTYLMFEDMFAKLAKE